MNRYIKKWLENIIQSLPLPGALLLLLFCSTLPLRADTTRIFTLSDFYVQVLEHHPVAQQAALLPEQARQEIRLARGSFDPVLGSYFNRKEFGGKDYFNVWDNALKVPVWYGLDLKAGFERNVGPYVNPERFTPTDGLSYAGLKVPLGQGWLIDERRATLRQAKLLPQLADAERLKEINKLLLSATKIYTEWQLAYQKLELYRLAVELSQIRLGAVKERVRQGDAAAIDTVEASIELQNRQQTLAQAQLDYLNQQLVLSTYLWQPGPTPAELPAYAIPEAAITPSPLLSAAELEELVEAARRNHPEILKLGVKAEQLRIEQRYRADKLKPKLDLDYTLLQRGFTANGGDAFSSSHMSNNYKLGVSFTYPLLLRGERGKLQLARLKVRDNELAQQQTAREVEAGIQSAYNQWQVLEEQVRLQEQVVLQTERLRNAEQIRFESGESSLFLINTRESSFVSSRVKLLELRAKLAQIRAQLYWAAGQAPGSR